MKWFKCLLALCALVAGQLVFASVSHAVSEYDNVIKTGGTANVSVANTAGGGVCSIGGPYSADLSTSWASYISDVSKYHSSYASQQPDVKAALQAAVNSNNKGRALFQYTVQGGRNQPMGGSATNYGDNDKYMILYISNNSTASFYSLYSGQQLVITGSWYVVVFAYGQLGSNCDVGIMEVRHGTGYSPEFIQQASYQAPEEKSISINFNIPDTSAEDYDGVQPIWDYTPPIPVTTAYTGTVDCFGENPLAMIIEQSSNDGAATLTLETLGRAVWEYELTSDPYSIAVNCGGTWTYSYGSVYASSTSGDWVCDPYTIRYDQPYCVLS